MKKWRAYWIEFVGNSVIHRLCNSGAYIKISSGVIFILCFYCCTPSGPEISLSDYEYDFGIIKPDSVYKGFVIIKNTGGDTLRIRGVLPDCGCTDASVTKKMVLPDDTCLLNFSFNAYNKSGRQSNHIFIEANTDSVVYLLNIHSFIGDSLKTE